MEFVEERFRTFIKEADLLGLVIKTEVSPGEFRLKEDREVPDELNGSGRMREALKKIRRQLSLHRDTFLREAEPAIFICNSFTQENFLVMFVTRIAYLQDHNMPVKGMDFLKDLQKELHEMGVRLTEGSSLAIAALFIWPEVRQKKWVT